MVESDFTGLSLRQRQVLKPFAQRLLPQSPRPIEGETQSSYCTRLGRMFNSDAETLLRELGIPPSVPLDVLETLPCSVLSERLAAATGRPIDRFVRMQHGPDDRALPFAEQTAFCPQCWLARRCLEAAYLAKSWARPWVFFCRQHPDQLLHERVEGQCWSDLFGRREQWAMLRHRTHPGVWVQACIKLGLDPVEEWTHTYQWLLGVQGDMEHVGPRNTASRVVCDLANYLQITWPSGSPQMARCLPAPIRTIDDQVTCSGRMLAGKLSVRLQTLISVHHLMSVLCNPPGTALGQFIAECLPKLHTEIENWWLRRRLLRWPAELQQSAHALFGLEVADSYAVPPFDPCRHCIGAASPALERRGLHFKLSHDFRCLSDAGDPMQTSLMSPPGGSSGSLRERSSTRELWELTTRGSSSAQATAGQVLRGASP